ncbi:hypothetical protein ACOME3_002826 [Neoechinorhynchus agilis]
MRFLLFTCASSLFLLSIVQAMGTFNSPSHAHARAKRGILSSIFGRRAWNSDRYYDSHSSDMYYDYGRPVGGYRPEPAYGPAYYEAQNNAGFREPQPPINQQPQAVECIDRDPRCASIVGYCYQYTVIDSCPRTCGACA